MSQPDSVTNGPETSMSLGERIKLARSRLRMSQKQLAADMGVSPPSLSEIENGQTKDILGAHLIRAARSLGVAPEWLEFGTGGGVVPRARGDQPLSRVDSVRDTYVRGPIINRLRAARDRLRATANAPHLLIEYVAAIEGLARALVLEHRSRGNQEHKQIHYKQLRLAGCESLLEVYFSERHGTTVVDEIDSYVWDTFREAIEWRNLLVHECTMINSGSFNQAIQACEKVFFVLIDKAGLSNKIDLPRLPEANAGA